MYLNFFNWPANDAFASAQAVASAFHDDYRRVDEPRFGDLVEFVSQGHIFHSAVYIAGGIVFTRNGSRWSEPFTLMPLAVLRNFYPSQHHAHVVYLHRKPQ